MVSRLQPKTKQQRSAKKRSLLSPGQKPTVKATKNTAKKTSAPKPVKPSKQVTATQKTGLAKAPAIKKTSAAAARRKPQLKKPGVRQTQLIRLPLGRGRKLVLALDRINSPSSKRKHPTKSRLAASKKNHPKKLDILFSSMLLVGGLLASAFFGLQVVASPTPELAVHSTPTQKIVVPPPKKQFLPPSRPVSLRIPVIQLDTALTSVGLLPDGTIEVPAEYMSAGWYRLSPTPGEIGPAIIVGHYDSTQGLTVFGRLRELLPGQTIEVSREDGKTAQFIIEKVEQFPQQDFPTDKVYSDIDYAGLRLITCGGSFNHLTKRYSDNTIIFATLIS